MSDRFPVMRYLEGIALTVLGFACACFALFGNYAYLMNPGFRWLTILGASLVTLMGLVALRSGRHSTDRTGVAALILLGVVVAVGRPHAYDVNALSLPERSEAQAEPLLIAGQRYTRVDLYDFRQDADEDPIDWDGRRVVFAGLIKRSPALDANGHFALVRIYSVCCAADAFMVGIRARTVKDVEGTDDWMDVYGTVKRRASPAGLVRIRQGSVHFASLSEEYVMETVRILPYVRPRPAEDLMQKLEEDNSRIFHRLANAAGFRAMIGNRGMVTVLVPVDAAFDRLPDGLVDSWLEGNDAVGLRDFVARHVLEGLYLDRDFINVSSARSLSGWDVPVRLENGRVRAAGSRLLFKNTEAKDGVIHLIYPPLWWPGKE